MLCFKFNRMLNLDISAAAVFNRQKLVIAKVDVQFPSESTHPGHCTPDFQDCLNLNNIS